MGIAAENINLFRYPGTKFFEPTQHNIFFGREQETSELVHSLKAHDVFVIFADSGIGKTSLLNAGIIPALQNEGFEAINFRFQDATIAPLTSVAKKLVDCCPSSYQFKEEKIKLWRLFKSCDFKTKTPLFILDQFEEFFNHPKQDREECIAELSDLVNDYLRDYIKDEMRQKFKEQDPTSDELKYYSAARVKMLFLIRADKLRFLDDLSVKIPLILRNRFHLKPLNVKQAEQAILLPATLPQNGFASPTFTYQPAALKVICNYLQNNEGEVESFQLQVLCQELEKNIMHRHQVDVNAALTITADELGGDDGMDNITKNYYKNQINSIPDEAQRKQAVALIEDKLIVNERRISLPEVLLTSQGYSKELLDFLLNITRLIRVDNDRYVEISHDRLLSSIIQSKELRQKEEEKLRQQQAFKQLQEERAESLRKLQKEQKIKHRFFIFSVLVTILLIASVFLFFRVMKSDSQAKISTLNYLISKDQYNEADSVLQHNNLFSFLNFYGKDSLIKLEAIIAENKPLHNKLEQLITNGDSALVTATIALTALDSLIPLADSLAELKRTGQKVNFETTANQLNNTLINADFTRALNYYKQAPQTGIYSEDATRHLADGIEDVKKKVPEAFKHIIDAAYVFLKAGNQQSALLAVKRAMALSRFAKKNDIELSEEDTPYLKDLQKLFQL